MKIKKHVSFILVSIFVFLVWGTKVDAASGTISVSSPTGNVGSTVTVHVTLNVSEKIEAATVYLSYPAGKLEYVTGASSSGDVSGNTPGSVRCFADVEGNSNQVSFSATLRIVAEGTHQLSASVNGYTHDTLDSINATGGGTITGKAVTTNNPGGSGTTNPTTPTNPGTTQTNKDSNNKLKNLQISPGSLTPAFNTNTTSYKVNVPEETTELIVSAAAQSNKANVSVTGHKNIKPGTNTVKVVVTSESGATRVYTLTVICGEATTNEEPVEEPEKIQIGGADYTINEAFTDDTIPAGFVRTKVTYKEKEYEALKHEKGKLFLVNLQNDAGNAFYIFNEETQEFYDFVLISFSESRYIIPLTLDDREQFAGYETTTVILQDKPFDAWKIDEDYSIIRAMDSEGEIVLYQYDSLDGTLQRYAEVMEQEPVEEPEETEMTFFSILEKYHLYIIAALGVVILALVIALICVAVRKKDGHDDQHDDYTEDFYVEPKKQPKSETKKEEKQPKEVEPQPKKRKHDARRRKAIKRLQKQQMKENR